MTEVRPRVKREGSSSPGAGDAGPAKPNVRPDAHASSVIPQRLVLFRVRTILNIVGIVLAVALVVEVVLLSKQVLAWIFIAVFLALALNPAVEWLQAHGLRRRGAAAGLTFLLAIGVIALIGAAFVPTPCTRRTELADALPGYVDDLTKGRGRLGFLERRYQVVEKVQKADQGRRRDKLLGLSDTALAVTKGIVTAIVATITIPFMTLFMLLEGPDWIDRFYAPPARGQPAALGGGRPRHLPHRRRLRDREPAHQPDRRHRRGIVLSRSACPTPSRSGCSWRCST